MRRLRLDTKADLLLDSSRWISHPLSRKNDDRVFQVRARARSRRRQAYAPRGDRPGYYPNPGRLGILCEIPPASLGLGFGHDVDRYPAVSLRDKSFLKKASFYA